MHPINKPLHASSLQDKDVKKLISIGAYDLVLIEDATEIFRDFSQNGYPAFFEHVLSLLTKSSKTTYHLYSETFNMSSVDYKDVVDNYKNYIKNLKTKKQYLVTILALDLAEEGGHYMAIRIDRNLREIIIFDAMQYSDDTTQLGEYTKQFARLTRDIFGKEYKIYVPECISAEFSLQYTGGFTGYYPYIVEQSNLEKNKKHLLSIQSTESQNHFCYMWSLWYLHILIIDKDPVDIINTISEKKIDPLIVIKKYIWSLLECFDLFTYIPDKYRDFFAYNFPCIWTNGYHSLSLHFNRYRVNDISMGRKKCTLLNIIKHSVSSSNLVVESKTKI